MVRRLLPRTAALAAALALALGAGAAGAKPLCSRYVFRGPASGWKSGSARFLALTAARLSWESRVSERLGPAWAFWINARNRHEACRERGDRWYCAVTARPCRLRIKGSARSAPTPPDNRP
ncbi:MAG: hypothetical protein D6832_01695 [Alphaproteobacteria bacterium]|nr:MAG: hypothetical protein D6832_01695 [Alphaproteobacteria bacterium]